MDPGLTLEVLDLGHDRAWHLTLGPLGGAARVETSVFRRFETRSGERAVADIVITADGEPVAQIEHEALIALSR